MPKSKLCGIIHFVAYGDVFSGKPLNDEVVITGEQEKMIKYHFFAAIPSKARRGTSRGNEAKATDYATTAGTSLENRLVRSPKTTIEYGGISKWS